MNQNQNCDGNHCTSATGEVRMYPLGGGANCLYCFDCWLHENRYRRQRVADGASPAAFPQENWAAAEVWEQDAKNDRSRRSLATELANQTRADIAAAAIEAMPDYSPADAADCLTDLLANLAHWADREGYSLARALAAAKLHYDAESGGAQFAPVTIAQNGGAR